MQKIVSISILLFLLSGCTVFRSGKKSMPEATDENIFSTAEILNNNITAGDFNIQKAEIQYIDSSGSEIKFIANLKYKHGGLYLASIRTRSGIEAARVFITKDTLLLNDRINKRLYCGSSEYIERKYGITADALPLIIGDLIYNKKEEAMVSCTEGQNKIIEKLGDSRITYTVDCKKKKAQEVAISREQIEKQIIIRYENFNLYEGRIYPRNIEIEESTRKSMIKIEIFRIEFNNPEELKFIPGNNYEKVIIK